MNCIFRIITARYNTILTCCNYTQIYKIKLTIKILFSHLKKI